MGHDICVYNKGDRAKKNEIAYLRYSMGNHASLLPYVALGSVEHYAGISGDGRTKLYSKKQIEKAKSMVMNPIFKDTIKSILANEGATKSYIDNVFGNYNKELKRLSEFLESILENMQHDKVRIGWW